MNKLTNKTGQDNIDLQALKESEVRFRSIVLWSPDAIIVTDAKGKIEYMNPAAEKVFNRKVGSFIGKDFGRPLVDGESTEIDIFRPGKESGVGDMHVVETEWLNKKAHLIMIRDITDRKKIEEEIKIATEVKSKFTSTVSHELRSPLGAIKEGVNIVLEGLAGNINDEQKDLLKIAKRNTDRLSRLINDVLDFQKIEKGKMEFVISENNINEVVGEVSKVMEITAKEKRLDLAVDTDDSIPKIKFDRDKIVQTLINLVDNAVKFTIKGRVSIRTIKENNEAHIIVADTGPGIKSENIKKLFQPFEQLASLEERKTGGTGLGLAISKEIILGHKGKIWAESKVGKGSEFHFTLPIKSRG